MSTARITLALIAIQGVKDEIRRGLPSWTKELEATERLFNLYTNLEDECKRAGLDARKPKGEK